MSQDPAEQLLAVARTVAACVLLIAPRVEVTIDVSEPAALVVVAHTKDLRGKLVGMGSTLIMRRQSGRPDPLAQTLGIFSDSRLLRSLISRTIRANF